MWRECVCLVNVRESWLGDVTIVLARSANVIISSVGTVDERDARIWRDGRKTRA